MAFCVMKVLMYIGCGVEYALNKSDEEVAKVGRSKGNLISKVKQKFKDIKKWVIRAVYNKRKLYLLYLGIICVAWIALFISIYSEISTHKSILENIGCSVTVAFINAAVIEKVAQTIGFGSILIVWIYSVLDKNELGFKYSELLVIEYPAYHSIVVGHMAAILFCLWLAGIKKLEGAILALLIVLLDCVIHWGALRTLVFYPSQRKNVAIKGWKYRVKVCKRQSPHEKAIFLCNMAHSLPKTSDEAFVDMLSCFCVAFQEYIIAVLNAVNSNPTILTEDVSNIWKSLFSDREEEEKTFLLNKINTYMETSYLPDNMISKRENHIIEFLCAGYFVWLYRSCTSLEMAKQIPIENMMIKIEHEIVSMERNVFYNKDSKFSKFCNAIFSLITLIHFMNGTA